MSDVTVPVTDVQTEEEPLRSPGENGQGNGTGTVEGHVGSGMVNSATDRKPLTSPQGHIGSGMPAAETGSETEGDGTSTIEGHVGSGMVNSTASATERKPMTSTQNGAQGHIGSGMPAEADSDEKPQPSPEENGERERVGVAQGHIGSGSAPVEPPPDNG